MELTNLIFEKAPISLVTVNRAKALNALATGLNLTVRNVATHTRHELSEQHALERLAAYSYLARLLDECEIDRGQGTDCS